jgi:hypothetical protein
MLVIALFAFTAGGGCADPYVESDASRAPASARSPEPVGDAAPPVAVPVRPPTGATHTARSPRRLAATFARQSTNWDWRDPTRPHRALRLLAVGDLRSEFERYRRSAIRDASLRRDRVGSRGRLIAVALSGRGDRRRLVVVTREEAIIDGRSSLEGPRYRVYLGSALRTHGGWGMESWQQQP